MWGTGSGPYAGVAPKGEAGVQVGLGQAQEAARLVALAGGKEFPVRCIDRTPQWFLPL